MAFRLADLRGPRLARDPEHMLECQLHSSEHRGELEEILIGHK